jgi:hypothetical protein
MNMNDQANVSSIDPNHALAVWSKTEDAKCWGAVDWIVGIGGRPTLVMLGGGGEVYAVMDITDGRVLDCDEMSADEIDRLGEVSLWRRQ